MSADRPTSQVYAGCCSAPRTRGVGGAGVVQGIVNIYLDGVGRREARRRFSAGWTLFSKLRAPLILATYVQQRIGDNQWDKICILGWKGMPLEQEAGAEDRDE